MIAKGKKMCSSSANPKAIPRRLLLPWKLFVAYVFVTMGISFFGPWYYVGYEKLYVFFFVLGFLLLSTIAFHIGSRKQVHLSVHRTEKSPKFPNAKFLKVSFVVAFLVCSLLLLSNLSKYGLHSGGNVADLMAKAYRKSVTHERVGSGLAFHLYQYGYSFCFIVMTLGLYRFRELKFVYKLLLIGVYITSTINTVYYVGSNKILGDILVIIMSVSLVKLARQGPSRLRVRHAFLGVIVVLSVLLALSSVLSARLGEWDVGAAEAKPAKLDPNHWMLRALPGTLVEGIGVAIYYPTQGYYGLSLSLQQPFEWTMGLGSSFALKSILAQLLGIGHEDLPKTYPERAELKTGYPAFASWHTIFPWLASDFTFLGAIVIVAIAAYVYSICWKESIYNENPFSLLLFAFLSILFVYVPANNQIAQTGTSLFAFVLAFVGWINRRKLVGYLS